MNRILYLVIFSLLSLESSGQSIDKVEAIIGDEIVLRSDIESQYLQYISSGEERSESVRCEIIEDLLFQKLLINQAKSDSVLVKDEDIDSEIEDIVNLMQNCITLDLPLEVNFGIEDNWGNAH